jgi:hypothetical protein
MSQVEREGAQQAGQVDRHLVQPCLLRWMLVALHQFVDVSA